MYVTMPGLLASMVFKASTTRWRTVGLLISVLSMSMSMAFSW
jgi:hypothetical protein